MPKRQDTLVWIDCEMTGLDPEEHVLIEIATIITDSQLNVLEEGEPIAIHQPPRALGTMGTWCRRQHGRSGLVERVKASEIDVAAAERMTLKLVRRHCYKRVSPLCGNSIGQDRRFLVKYMPTLHEYFHYRSIDVSTVKELVGRWYRGTVETPEKGDTHLALDDIRGSIDELKFYREKVFRDL